MPLPTRMILGICLTLLATSGSADYGPSNCSSVSAGCGKVFSCRSGYNGGIAISAVRAKAYDSGQSGGSLEDNWWRIGVDLNRNAGGKWIYLEYAYVPGSEGKTQGEIGPLITDIKIENYDDAQAGGIIGDGWWRDSQDLSEGAGGKYTYLEYKLALVAPPSTQSVRWLNVDAWSCDPGVNKPINQLSASEARQCSNQSKGWCTDGHDINKDAGGDWIYLKYLEWP